MNNHPASETFDPPDWNEFRKLAHWMVDEVCAQLETLAQQPAWQPMPEDVRASFSEPLPWDPEGEAEVTGRFFRDILPYANGNRHPRFFGWVQGNGTPLGMMADMLASAMNSHLAGFNQAPALVEKQVIAWLAELFDLPKDASGVFVTGGTMANLLGVAVARHAKAGYDVRQEGVQQNSTAPMTLYCSTEVHHWIHKTVEFLGLGTKSLRSVPIDDEYRMRPESLQEMIRQDRASGRAPFCVVATVGTINTGAIDDVAAIADICQAEDLWLHVDSAFGGFAKLSEKWRHLAPTFRHIDSLGVDLHKWISMPFECACVLVRDPEMHHAAFASTPHYLKKMERGVAAGGIPFADRGIDLTRGFKALKAWMSFKAYGLKKFGKVIEQNIDQTRFLAERIEEHSSLELLAPAPLNIVCFRYVVPNLPPAELNQFNHELLMRIQESGVAVPSSTVLPGDRFALRVANVNHRTTFGDIEALLDITLKIGKELAQAHR